MIEPVEQLNNPEEPIPLSVSDVLADLRGFGIEEFEEILTLTISGKTIRIKLSNVPTDGDLMAMVAVEGMKNYAFFQEVKIELLSRAITWINGIDINKLTKLERRVKDPEDGLPKDIQVVLRGLIKSWGLEVMQVLWKVLMVHSQSIENRLFDSFPQAAVLTDVERRYQERIQKDLEQMTKDALQDRVDQILGEDTEPEEVAS
jgi:hypothetical protein